MDVELVTEQEAQSILSVRKVDQGSVENKDTSNRPLVKLDRLPSGFKGYPQGTVISYDPITLGELEALNNGESPDIERGIAMLLNAINCNTIPVEDLYYWDVMFIGIQRKLLAFGDTRGTIYGVCPECGSVVERVFDYTELEFKELSVPDLPIITKINDTEVEISLLTIKEFLQLSPEDSDLSVYAKMIKNLSYDESLQLLNNAYGEDIRVIRYIDKLLNYGLKPLEVKCTGEVTVKDEKGKAKKQKCKKVFNVEVKSPFEVVFPEDDGIGYNNFEIQFGRK